LEASASIEIAKHTLVSCGLILAIGTITGLLAQKIKIPDVAVFLIVGMLIGPEALGLINIKADSALNQIILLFGASYILFDGGDADYGRRVHEPPPAVQYRGDFAGRRGQDGGPDCARRAGDA